MLSFEARERLTDIQERLLRLYVLRRYAVEDGDSSKAGTFQKEIAPLEEERKAIRRWDTVGSAREGERGNGPKHNQTAAHPGEERDRPRRP